MKMQNFFMAQLKPVSKDERNDSKVLEIQKACIALGICGMGWWPRNWKPVKSTDDHLTDCPIKYGIAENLSSFWETDKSRSMHTALNRYSEMKDGDYILTRLMNSECYIGKIKGEPYFTNDLIKSSEYEEKYPDEKEPFWTYFSWVVDVDWKQIGAFCDIPGALRGLMQKRLPTISHIYSDIAKELIETLYNGEPKTINLNPKNFTESLDYLDLEDLVQLYMSHLPENKGYILMSSSCKVSTPIIEFIMQNGNDKITCQVKNYADVDMATIKDIDESFKRIYLFSALNIINSDKNWEPDQKKYIEIKKVTLYGFLRDCYLQNNHPFHKIILHMLDYKDIKYKFT